MGLKCACAFWAAWSVRDSLDRIVVGRVSTATVMPDCERSSGLQGLVAFVAKRWRGLGGGILCKGYEENSVRRQVASRTLLWRCNQKGPMGVSVLWLQFDSCL